jgi:all-trans-retinol dehydrogenase (NAD+)
VSTIAGSRALVTGGASGIDRLMALKLASLGADVVVWDINKENLDAVVEDLGRAGTTDAHGYLCDVSDRADVYRAAARVKDEVGGVDILINNAGIVSGKRFLDLADEKIEATFKINSLALFWTAKAFLPDMLECNRGHVVTIASAAGYVGVSQLTDYSASKWAAVAFDESLRVELKKAGSRVQTTVVCPYYINTGMFTGVKSRVPWLLPILDEDTVAERVVAAIQRNKRRLVLPPFVNFVPMARMLPVPLFDAVMNFLGVNASMEEFVGRDSDRAPLQRSEVSEAAKVSKLK